ncbi:3-oxoacyl-ACP synthase [Oceanobacillus picturae]|uniref:3-oxoacyl-ACP synthase n=1 Tax=Oceanobacillus picturae TaxID=171693 RepID=A0A0U9HAK1_9BACI|nr:3-oxoacyl-ACP synthase [Oceanobacillus picturae]
MNESMPIAVTGMGTVSPYGVGLTTFWDNLIANKSAVKEVEDEQLHQWAPVGARVQDFNPAEYLPKKLVKNTDRFTQLALIAATEALSNAGILGEDGETLAPSIDPERIGTSIGSAFGGIQSLEEGSGKLATGKASRVGPRLISKCIPNAAAATIAKALWFTRPFKYSCNSLCSISACDW